MNSTQADTKVVRKLLGLIGKKLVHSQSPALFADIFRTHGVSGWEYRLFEMPDLAHLQPWAYCHPTLLGFNVTIPYKKAILPHLSALSDEAAVVGSVNTVHLISDEQWVGYNTDVLGFEKSLFGWLSHPVHSALILGTGGAAQAVAYVLDKYGIAYHVVSRNPSSGDFTYENLPPERVRHSSLIINTTPLGMYPDIHTCPNIPYCELSDSHWAYDLVYNPEKTLFLKKCESSGAAIKNGKEMLSLQAIAAWKIWNT